MSERPAAGTVEAAIRDLEEDLLKPEVRRSRERMSELLAGDFVEFASSGVAYNRQQILEALEHEGLEEPPVRRVIAHHEVLILAGNVALARYRIVRTGRPGEVPTQSLRSSVWRLEEGRWRMVFHQGTLVAAR